MAARRCSMTPARPQARFAADTRPLRTTRRGSFHGASLGLPYGAVVDTGRNQQQRSADAVEEQPGDHQSGDGQQSAEHAAKSRGARFASRDDLAQTFGADDAVLMFGDALAAEKSQAHRAAGDGFPEFVVKTALLDRGGNGYFLMSGVVRPTVSSAVSNEF